ncbi:Crp/Fnr family transcriptional regulator [Deinococcus yavapaiensis]|uniref:Crp/Fnr family transcriptional regulator n=1 Tax=Deinococcus yavapaiensis KR-236 TaxID=694435 RepID=A0A318S5B1_9DEIO|nr:Crp/Fnr family transcriptional regulator [Deinococcus yavapaiensis]PYE53874.1 Crp/Fnr family transcriptional regulator [Deinococcus yavapaiensis KR-236]
MTSSKAEEVLLDCSVFRGLPREILEVLARDSTLTTVHVGQTIFFEGDLVDSLYLMASGWAKVYKQDPNGRKQLVLHIEGPGQVLAEVAVFLERRVYPASCEALEDSEVLRVASATFHHCVEQYPVLARNVIRYLASRQSKLVHLVDKMFFQELASRLAQDLLERLERDGQGYCLPSNPEMAAMLGTVPELISRKLGHLYRQKLIRLEGRRVWIPDPDALATLLPAPMVAYDH